MFKDVLLGFAAAFKGKARSLYTDVQVPVRPEARALE